MAVNTSYIHDGAIAAIGHAHTTLGTKAPHTKQPWSEAMLFGLSGGVGHGYILWEFQKNQSAPLVLGLVHRWNYPAERFEKATKRSGLKVTTTTTASAKKAETLLEAQLAKGVPTAVRTDWLHCPYVWYLTIDEIADGVVTAHDTGKAPVEVSMEALSTARAKVPSLKNALIGFGKGKAISKTALKTNIKAAIGDAVAYQTTNSDSFSLKAFQKWSHALTDDEMDKSWPKVLGDGPNLLPALITLYQRIRLTGSDAMGMRGLYADFLDEAAVFTHKKELEAAATAYRQSAKAWAKLAETALPKKDAAFSDIRKLVDARGRAHKAGGPNALNKVAEIEADIAAYIKASRTKFPLNKGERLALFANLKDALDKVIEAEQSAIEALVKAHATL